MRNSALALLLEARQSAELHARDAWEFAVELPVLLAAGITVTVLRSLVCEGTIEHGQETTTAKHKNRRFRRTTNLCFPPGTCFVLAANASLASTSADDKSHAHTVAPSHSHVKPHWDADARTLSVLGQIVKRFRVPAKCQEIVLSAFEEDGWPTYIDDPLPGSNGEDPKYRLHNTIKALNGHHLVKLIRFTGNGNGHGVAWEFVETLQYRRTHARSSPR